MSRSSPARAALFFALAAALALTGCAKKESRRGKPITRKGVIKSVNLEKRYAKVEVHDRTGDKLEMDGSFTDETVVTIDGRPAKFEDVRPGDPVEVTVKLKGKGIDLDIIATRVDIIRAASTSSAPAG